MADLEETSTEGKALASGKNDGCDEIVDKSEIPDNESSDDDSKTGFPYQKKEKKVFAGKKREYMKKLRQLHLKRNEARKLNHQELVEEDRRNKLPANWEAKRRAAEWELEEQKKKAEAEAAGEDYERLKLLQQPADELERFERKKKRKNPDQGFSDYAAAQLRQYQRLTKQMKPDLEEYSKMKEELGDAAFPSAHSLYHGGEGKVSKAGVDRMVADLEKQIEKRSKFSRRRQHFDEADIDYINERNKKFNEKAERYYGRYTEEIKQNLERGTAI